MKRYIWWVNVGQLPKNKAQEHLKNVRDNFDGWWPRKGEWIFQPFRGKYDESDRIEIFDTNE